MDQTERTMELTKNEEITCFTLGELSAMNGTDRRRKGLLGECVTATSYSQMVDFRFPCRIDAFIIGVGTDGETSVSYNLHDYRLTKGSMFLFGPKNILQIQSNEQFKAHVLAVSTDFMERIDIDTKHMMPLFLQFSEHPCLSISSEESRTLCDFITLIERETRGSESRFSYNVLNELIAATLYKTGDILHRYLAEHPQDDEIVRTRAEEYFRQFMKLLGKHYREERTVGFYARQLCITPKYLTTLIKRISSKSVSEWIDTFVTLEAKTLLKYSNMSIQEIAYYLNFPNQSFFGSYFKRNTGMSPSQYKAAQ